MKKIIFSVIMMMMVVAVKTQSAYEMNVDGVKVIVQPGNNEILQILTVIKGGVQNYSFAKQGIESLAMTALTECGTVNDDKNAFKDKLDKVAAFVGASAGMDYASVTLNCILSDFETVWPLYSDAITKPAFNTTEFARIKQDALNRIRASQSQPDYAIEQMAMQTAFAGQDYAKNPDGTVETISKITTDETKAYYKSILTKARLVIVVVGDVDKANLEQKIKTMLASVPQGKPFVQKKLNYKPATNTFKSEKKDFATNYIQGVSSAPTPDSPDFNAFMMAIRIFYSRHFDDVRSKNGLSYAPGVHLNGGTSSSSNLTVSTKKPNDYIRVANQLIKRTREEGFTEDEVKNIKTAYATNFYYRQETNDALANSLATNEVVHGNWRRSLTLTDDLKNISREDVNKAFNKYITKFAWTYMGDPTQVDPQLYTGKLAADSSVKKKVDLKKKG